MQAGLHLEGPAMAKPRSPQEGLPAKAHLVLSRMQGKMSPGAMLAIGGRIRLESVDVGLWLRG